MAALITGTVRMPGVARRLVGSFATPMRRGRRKGVARPLEPPGPTRTERHPRPTVRILLTLLTTRCQRHHGRRADRVPTMCWRALIGVLTVCWPRADRVLTVC